jgi:hypothetical protein
MHVKGSSIILQDHITDAVQKLACVAGAILGGRARVGEARGEGKGERKGARKNGRGEMGIEGNSQTMTSALINGVILLNYFLYYMGRGYLLPPLSDLHVAQVKFIYFHLYCVLLFLFISNCI